MTQPDVQRVADQDSGRSYDSEAPLVVVATEEQRVKRNRTRPYPETPGSR